VWKDGREEGKYEGQEAKTHQRNYRPRSQNCKNILRGEINFITSHFHNELIIRCILK